MARTKNTTKEPVRIRFKELADGSKSIYLDIYRNGKRKYEFLKLYLVPEKTTLAKQQNTAVLAAANTIKSQRIIEIAGNAAGLPNHSLRSAMLLTDFLEKYKTDQERKKKRGMPMLTQNLVNLTKQFNPKLTMRDLDRQFCIDFVDFLRNTYKTSQGKPLAESTCMNYFSALRTALNEAVRSDIIAANPMHKLAPNEKPKAQESKREFLTIDELRQMMTTPCEPEEIKRAYIFSCYCGLRISDVKALRWKDITKDGDQYRVELIMKKTTTPIYLPLSVQAVKWLPERNDADAEEKVFKNLPAESTISKHLAKWATSAGITKKITFHTARHTFATMLITLGTSIYVVSKLLGHSDVATTERYSKCVNSKKNDAMALIDKEFEDTM